MSSHIIDAIVSGESSSDISQEIKNILFSKSADRIDDYRQVAANKLFADSEEGEVEWLKIYSSPKTIRIAGVSIY